MTDSHLEGWLVTWQQIAEYCKRDVRTVKRYHYCYGLPVYRLPSGIRVAIPAQLNAWLKGYNFIKYLRYRKKVHCTGASCLVLLSVSPDLLMIYEDLLK
jgi:hypothetical protein